MCLVTDTACHAGSGLGNEHSHQERAKLDGAGGSGAGLTWTVSVNSSGGSITQAGNYTAGSKGGGTDTVKVTDSLGNSSTVVITLTAGLAISPTTANAFPLQSVVGTPRTLRPT